MPVMISTTDYDASGGGLLARMAGFASRYAGPLGVVTSALTADTQPTTGPVAERAAREQKEREAEFVRRQFPAGRTADIDLPRVPQLTRDIALSEIRKAASGRGR